MKEESFGCKPGLRGKKELTLLIPAKSSAQLWSKIILIRIKTVRPWWTPDVWTKGFLKLLTDQGHGEAVHRQRLQVERALIPRLQLTTNIIPETKNTAQGTLSHWKWKQTALNMCSSGTENIFLNYKNIKKHHFFCSHRTNITGTALAEAEVWAHSDWQKYCSSLVTHTSLGLVVYGVAGNSVNKVRGLC